MPVPRKVVSPRLQQRSEVVAIRDRNRHSRRLSSLPSVARFAACSHLRDRQRLGQHGSTIWSNGQQLHCQKLRLLNLLTLAPLPPPVAVTGDSAQRLVGDRAANTHPVLSTLKSNQTNEATAAKPPSDCLLRQYNNFMAFFWQKGFVAASCHVIFGRSDCAKLGT